MHNFLHRQWTGKGCGPKISEPANAVQALRHHAVAATIFLRCLACIYKEKGRRERERGRERERERERDGKENNQ